MCDAGPFPVLLRRRMTDLRSTLASILCAVLVLGGVVLPSVHHAAHGAEAAEDRASHIEAYHGDHEAEEASGALATAPCAPAPNDVDCAVCSVLTVASEIDSDPVPYRDGQMAAATATDRVHTASLLGIGARAPPVG